MILLSTSGPIFYSLTEFRYNLSKNLLRANNLNLVNQSTDRQHHQNSREAPFSNCFYFSSIFLNCRTSTMPIFEFFHDYNYWTVFQINLRKFFNFSRYKRLLPIYLLLLSEWSMQYYLNLIKYIANHIQLRVVLISQFSSLLNQK